jgi:hypothetical protein
MNDTDLHKELSMRAELSKKMMDAASEMPVNVVFDVMAYVVAQCITQATDISPTKLLEDFNARVVEMHRVIAESDEGSGAHTLQ